MEIVFSDDKLTPSEKKKIEELILESGKINYEELHLDDLEKIILTNNYFEEVESAWLSIGKENKGASNNDVGKGIGIAISNKPLDKDAKSIVLINENQWRNLLGDNTKMLEYCIHVINHELCHVHDDTHKHGQIYSEDMKQGNSNDLQFRLRCEADLVWGEYIAERLSSGTVTKEFVYGEQNVLYNVLKKIFEINEKNNVFVLREMTRNRNQSDFKFYIEYAMLSFARLQGITHGLGKNHEWSKMIDSYLRNWLNGHGLVKVWDKIGVSLDCLHDIYPDWSDIDQLDELGSCIRESWKCFGYDNI